jgi:hypothetical protein
MSLPECNQNCKDIFHMTSGRHKTNCALHKYDEIVQDLELIKMLILSGEKVPKAFLARFDEFVCD